MFLGGALSRRSGGGVDARVYDQLVERGQCPLHCQALDAEFRKKPVYVCRYLTNQGGSGFARLSPSAAWWVLFGRAAAVFQSRE